MLRDDGFRPRDMCSMREASRASCEESKALMDLRWPTKSGESYRLLIKTTNKHTDARSYLWFVWSAYFLVESIISLSIVLYWAKRVAREQRDSSQKKWFKVIHVLL